MIEMSLPEEFLSATVSAMGEERFARFLAALDDEPPVSIRLNPKKPLPWLRAGAGSADRVPWCEEGIYLPRRPNFTFDPLLHAGCYYVQEAASQFVTHVVRNLALPSTLTSLDLCAAPGGKSTALRSVLPDDCLLVSNEPVRQRAQVLSENIQKWGYGNCLVTNNYPQDFARNGCQGLFDLVVCDVPCSGEGMFRKDHAAIGEWSPQGVERCWRLQRQIVTDIWPCLRDGGIMIYSTCTYNTKENEENVRWLMEQTDARPVAIATGDGWGIAGSLLPGFDAPVYRFIPGMTRCEGLFMAVLQKPADGSHGNSRKAGKALSRLNILFDSRPEARHTSDKNDTPSCAEALSATLDPSRYPVADLPYPAAIAYLRREAIVLPPDTPRGLVVVSFMGHALGFAKNIGQRANNLYPREWAIKSTHVPAEYAAF